MKTLTLLALALATLTGCAVHTQRGPRRTVVHQEPQQQPTTVVVQQQPAATPPPGQAVTVTVLVQPDVEEIPEPGNDAGPPVRIRAGAALGRPLGLQPGAATAYWIWHDRRGIWHLRTTSDSGPHVFRGRITVRHGEQLAGFLASRNELGDRWLVRPRATHFALRTGPHEDGFNFTSTSSCVRLVLRKDGEPAPTVFVGRDATPANSDRIIVCR